MVANEMMMGYAFGVESGRAAFNGHFPYQTGLHQIPQIVIRGRSRTARVQTIDTLEDFGSRRMALVFQQEQHHGIALRRTTQAVVLERLFDFLSVHQSI
jgi:hypothetical protein